MQRATPGYCELCGHIDHLHRIGLGLRRMCDGCPGGRCLPEPEYLGTEWERLEMATRRGRASRAAGTNIALGSEIYLWWIQVNMAYGLAGSEPDKRHLFEKFLKSQSAAFRVLAARDVVETKPKMTKRRMLVEIGEYFATFLKDCADDFPAEVEEIRGIIDKALDLFPVPFTEDDVTDDHSAL